MKQSASSCMATPLIAAVPNPRVYLRAPTGTNTLKHTEQSVTKFPLPACTHKPVIETTCSLSFREGFRKNLAGPGFARRGWWPARIHEEREAPDHHSLVSCFPLLFLSLCLSGEQTHTHAQAMFSRYKWMRVYSF